MYKGNVSAHTPYQPHLTSSHSANQQSLCDCGDQLAANSHPCVCRKLSLMTVTYLCAHGKNVSATTNTSFRHV
jgi:hypothetical protein